MDMERIHRLGMMLKGVRFCSMGVFRFFRTDHSDPVCCRVSHTVITFHSRPTNPVPVHHDNA